MRFAVHEQIDEKNLVTGFDSDLTINCFEDGFSANQLRRFSRRTPKAVTIPVGVKPNVGQKSRPIPEASILILSIPSSLANRSMQ